MATSQLERQPLVVRLSADDRGWLDELAEQQDRSVAAVVRRLVAEAREREQTEGPDLVSGPSSSP
jgi:predicted transcriptional regulator